MTARLDLILLRHGQAEDALSGQDDHARKLTNTGRGEAFKTAHGLIERSIYPRVILCSDAQRTQETSHEVLRVLGESAPPVLLDAGLYHASRETALMLLQSDIGEQDIVLVIGHNPTLSRLASYLSGETVQLDTAEAVHMTFDAKLVSRAPALRWKEALAASGLWTLRAVWRG